jgi:signal transduction histidine kinase
LDALPFGVLLLEPRSRDVILANQALLTMLGVARFERDALRTPAGEPLDESAWPVDRTLRTRLPVVDTRLSLLRPDGDVAVLDVRTTPVSERGRMQAVLATFVDLDARATQERADAEFVSNAAHNLRNPLTVISTAVEILQAGAKEDEAERDRFLAHIEREAERMLQLTRSLLTLSQADHGGEPPRWRAVPADELLRAVAAAVRPAQEVRLVVDTTPDVVAYTDAALLQQALANLAENAVRHTRSGSIVLHGSRSNGGVLFRVTDTGDGIPGAGHDVFERGSRRELREDGFGLGLAIVRRIAEALSADLELESEVGVGTSVSLLVPFRGGGR